MRIHCIVPGVFAFIFSAVAPDVAEARGRIYHPGMGRFVQRDPVATALQPHPTQFHTRSGRTTGTRFTARDRAGSQYRDGMNLYQYVKGNPVVFLDPSGLAVIMVIDPTRAGDHPLVVNDDGVLVPDKTRTFADASREFAKHWNETYVDTPLKFVRSTKENFKFHFNGQEVDKATMLASIENLRMTVVVLPKGKNDAAKAIQQAAVDAGAAGQVVLETHSMRDIPGQDQPGINIGGEVVDRGTFTKLIGQLPTRLVLGACWWSKDQVKQLAQQLNTSVAASGGTSHPVTPLAAYGPIEGNKGFEVTVQTPFDLQEHRHEP